MTRSGAWLRTVLARRLPWLVAAALLGASLPLWQEWVPTATGRWLADLAVHWQWLYGLGGLASAALWCAVAPPRARRWPWLALGGVLVFLALNLAVTPLPRLAAAPAGPAGAVKIVSFNLNLDNRSFDAVRDWVALAQPDVLALVEVTPGMQPLLSMLAARYPHASLHPRDDPFGLAVFSRHPMQGAHLLDDGRWPPRWHATMQAPGEPFRLTVVHPMPPISPVERAHRDALFEELSRDPADGVIVGDFNATPWSAGLRRMAGAGWGRATTLQPTFALLRSLPIDHILAAHARWRVAGAGVGPWLGSDHRPVWALLQPASAARP